MPPRSQSAPLTPQEGDFIRSLLLEEDDIVLALNKPPGLSSQGGRGGQRTLDDLLQAFARSNGKRPELVHRLDKDTSGVILAAKTKPALSALGKALMERRVRKTYWALVAASPPQKDGRLDQPLRREELGREAFMRACDPDHPDAQNAVTLYRTLAVGPHGALLELRPVTGRMHQLRVHLSVAGRPILGDARYGGRLTLGTVAVPRLMLHALELDFPDPQGGGRRRVAAPPPADFLDILARCGVDAASLPRRGPSRADALGGRGEGPLHDEPTG
jgi:tRNA pseudouridine32 synthase/23S rRNA pseudouridine746 synthase